MNFFPEITNSPRIKRFQPRQLVLGFKGFGPGTKMPRCCAETLAAEMSQPHLVGDVVKCQRCGKESPPMAYTWI
jgi:hypothetical protein